MRCSIQYYDYLQTNKMYKVLPKLLMCPSIDWGEPGGFINVLLVYYHGDGI